MTVKNLVNQDTFITISRNDWDKEVEVDSVETLWIPYHDEDDQFSVEFSGFDESLSSTSVRLYIPTKTMEFLCHEFNEYKELNRKEREPEEAVSTPSEVKTDTSSTAGNLWSELTSLLSILPPIPWISPYRYQGKSAQFLFLKSSSNRENEGKR